MKTKIKERRKQLGMTLAELEQKAGYSPSMLSRWENNRRPIQIDHLENIANALGVKVEDLLIPDEEPQTGPTIGISPAIIQQAQDTVKKIADKSGMSITRADFAESVLNLAIDLAEAERKNQKKQKP